jgi:hypothetical protein
MNAPPEGRAGMVDLGAADLAALDESPAQIGDPSLRRVRMLATFLVITGRRLSINNRHYVQLDVSRW